MFYLGANPVGYLKAFCETFPLSKVFCPKRLSCVKSRSLVSLFSFCNRFTFWDCSSIMIYFSEISHLSYLFSICNNPYSFCNFESKAKFFSYFCIFWDKMEFSFSKIKTFSCRDFMVYSKSKIISFSFSLPISFTDTSNFCILLTIKFSSCSILGSMSALLVSGSSTSNMFCNLHLKWST